MSFSDIPKHVWWWIMPPMTVLIFSVAFFVGASAWALLTKNVDIQTPYGSIKTMDNVLGQAQNKIAAIQLASDSVIKSGDRLVDSLKNLFVAPVNAQSIMRAMHEPQEIKSQTIDLSEKLDSQLSLIKQKKLELGEINAGISKIREELNKLS